MFASEDVPPPPIAAFEQGAARRRRHRRRPGAAGERPAPGAGPMEGGHAGGKPRSLDEELQQVGWMLREFKTAPCSLENPSSHDHRCCPFYHSSRDRRRPILAEGEAAYQGEPCPSHFDDSRTCNKGDACTLCHSTAELLYHPDFFRKRLCHQARRCPRGRFCAFAHARHELLAPHFSEDEEAEPTEEFIASRFKTQWCPVGGPHDWESCVYAHTYRDWRRVPLLGYASHPCPRWANSVASGSPGLAYGERCPYGMACPLAHGAKEQLYHPQFYKTSPCSDPDCRRGPLCAFTHGENDQRQLPLDENAPRAARRPIPQAEDILRQHQPTFSEPPMYHALEDAPRSGGGGGGAGAKPRRRKGGGGGGEAAAAGPAPTAAAAAPTAAAPAPAAPSAASSGACAAPAPAATGDASRVELVGRRPPQTLPLAPAQDQRSAAVFAAPYPACQFMGYQWVLSPTPAPQPMQPGLGGPFLGAAPGFGAAVPGFGAGIPGFPATAPGFGAAGPSFSAGAPGFAACYAPPAPPAPQPQGPGAAQCLLTVPSPPPATSPCPSPGPSPADSPVRVNRHSSEDAADRSPIAVAANPRSPMDLKVPAMPLLGGLCSLQIEVPDFSTNPPDFAAWQQSLAEVEVPGKMSSGGLSAWKRRYSGNDGLRTPSSFGSPALSLAPTRASSPRSAEGNSSTHTVDGSEQGPWDEYGAPREEPVLLMP